MNKLSFIKRSAIQLLTLTILCLAVSSQSFGKAPNSEAKLPESLRALNISASKVLTRQQTSKIRGTALGPTGVRGLPQHFLGIKLSKFKSVLRYPRLWHKRLFFWSL